MRIGIGLGVSQIRSAGDGFAINGLNPEMVSSFENDFYRTNSSPSTFDSQITYTGASNKTMIDSDGLLKWASHNLALNSATPATQNITVVIGQDYTVEVSGAGSITLSGAGTGSVTDGNPVEITATTTTLTLTVVGSLDRMWAYRSDLGGVAPVPIADRIAGSLTYVPTVASPVYRPRRNAYAYIGGVLTKKGLQFESAAATNLLLNSNTLVTQNVTVTAVPHTLHFTGTGTVTLSGVSTAGPLVGTGAGENNRVNLTFTPTAGSLTLTVTGSVTFAQLEASSTPSSYIPTAGATATRAAEALTVPATNLPYSATAMSIAMNGLVTYADTASGQEAIFVRWLAAASDLIDLILRDAGSGGLIRFEQRFGGIIDTVDSGIVYTPGVKVPFSIASRHGSTFINGAVDGTALTADLTPVALPDLSATNLSLAPAFNGYISEFRMWGQDIADTGIAKASA